MKKQLLAMAVVGSMALPAQALAEICFTDDQGAAYSFEVGQQQGRIVPIHGFRQVGNGCLEGLNGVEPLSGEVVVLDSNTAAAGFHVNADEASEDCYSFRMTASIDLQTGDVEGEWRNDNGNDGSISLQFSASCPDAGSLPTALAPVGVGPDKKSN